MKSARPKVLHRVAGLPMIEHVLAASAALQPRSTTLVVGHQADSVRAALLASSGRHVRGPGTTTWHRSCVADDRAGASERRAGTLVLLSGDVPLLSAKTLKSLVDRHESSGAAATVVTAVVDQPAGLRAHRAGWPSDCSHRRGQRRHAGGAGNYARSTPASTRLPWTGCSTALTGIATENAQGEYYLPDIVALFRSARSRSRNADGDGRGRDPGHQQPPRAGGSEPNRETDKKSGPDGRGRHDRGPGDHLRGSARRDRAGHDHPSRRVARGPHDDRERAAKSTAGSGLWIHAWATASPFSTTA